MKQKKTVRQKDFIKRFVIGMLLKFKFCDDAMWIKQIKKTTQVYPLSIPNGFTAMVTFVVNLNYTPGNKNIKRASAL